MVSFGCRLQIKRWFFFLKTFGLDRISDLDITTASFTREEINIEETLQKFFRYHQCRRSFASRNSIEV